MEKIKQPNEPKKGGGSITRRSVFRGAATGLGLVGLGAKVSSLLKRGEEVKPDPSDSTFVSSAVKTERAFTDSLVAINDLEGVIKGLKYLEIPEELQRELNSAFMHIKHMRDLAVRYKLTELAKGEGVKFIYELSVKIVGSPDVAPSVKTKLSEILEILQKAFNNFPASDEVPPEMTSRAGQE